MKNVVSLFTGRGLLDIGASRQFNIVYQIDKEANAYDTLRANRHYFPNSNVVCGDIFAVSDEEILKLKEKNISGVIGGPMCQAFSPGAHGFNPHDERIKGIFEFLRWVRLIEPEFFLMENTEGLLHAKKKPIYQYWEKQAQALGYTVHMKVLNAHDYGSPQKRLRLIAVGVKDNKWPFVFPQEVKEKKFVRDMVLYGEDAGEYIPFSAKQMQIVPHVSEGCNWRDLPEDLQRLALQGNFEKREGGMTRVYKRLHRDDYCLTLTTCPTQRNTMAIHPTEDRPLSVKEYAKAFSVPDDYVFVGSTRTKYHAIGNGVCVDLSEKLFKSIAQCMEMDDVDVPPIYVQGRFDFEDIVS